MGAGSAEMEHLLNESDIKISRLFLFRKDSSKMNIYSTSITIRLKCCENEITGISYMLLSANKCSISALPAPIYQSVGENSKI